MTGLDNMDGTHDQTSPVSSSNNRLLFRPFMETPEHQVIPGLYSRLRHPLFAWIGLRPIFAQHTRAEHEALQRWVRGRKTVVEIGVAEGGSALALRQAMPPNGALYLIDPYHLSRIRWLNALRRAALACVRVSDNGRVVWMEEFSAQAAAKWSDTIDFILFDGDHAEEAVRYDWQAWHRFLRPGGVAAFHDARVFPGGWPAVSDGPVKLVDSLFRQERPSEWDIVDEVHSLVIARRSV